MTRNSRRIVVIGAGVAGLCAAVYAHHLETIAEDVPPIFL